MTRQETLYRGFVDGASWQLARLRQAGMLRNPARKKKVPAYIKETPRSAATGVSVFPRRKEAWPIGDLFHARLALIYAMAPTHRSQRAGVVQAVAHYYPEYSWATWWNKEIKKPKKDSTLKTWGAYMKQRVSRAGRGSWEQSDSRTKRRNPDLTWAQLEKEATKYNQTVKKTHRLGEPWKRLVEKYGKEQAKFIREIAWKKQDGLRGKALRASLLGELAVRRKNPAKGLSAWQKFVRKEAKAAKAAGKKTPSATKLSAKYHREEAKKCKTRHTPKKKAPAQKKTTAKGNGKRPSKTAYLNTKAKDYRAFQKEMARKYPGAGIQSGETGDMWQKIKAHRAKKKGRK